jgi:hypothetical protein
MFQDEAPLLRIDAHSARTQTRTPWPSTWWLLKAMGAGPAGRIAQAVASRLDDIGRRAIGDMVSSASTSSSEGAGSLKATSPSIIAWVEGLRKSRRSQIRNAGARQTQINKSR